MKKILLSGLISLAFLAFGATQATASNFNEGMLVASMDKCGSGKCGGAKKNKCGAGKCGGDMKKKSKKCGAGKCGGGKKGCTTERKSNCDDGKCDSKMKKGKCGDGKCGGDMKKKSKKCGAGKCGKA